MLGGMGAAGSTGENAGGMDAGGICVWVGGGGGGGEGMASEGMAVVCNGAATARHFLLIRGSNSTHVELTSDLAHIRRTFG